MFISTEQYKPHRGDKLHLQPQRHHHGTRHLQQFGQLHHPYRSRCLAARRYLLLPDSRRHGSLSPAALLLKPGPAFSSLPQHSSSPPIHSSHQSSLTPLSFTARRPQD